MFDVVERIPYKTRDEIAMAIGGTCFGPTDRLYEWYGVTEDEVESIMIEFDVEQCEVCGWYLYPGEYCTMHDHDGIICEGCCEEEDDE